MIVVFAPTPLTIEALVEAFERTFSEAVVLNCRLIAVSADDLARVAVVLVDDEAFVVSVAWARDVKTPEVDANAAVIPNPFCTKRDRFCFTKRLRLIFRDSNKTPPIPHFNKN